jgi:putative DNA primase/helicase
VVSLAPKHLADLQGSGLSDATIAAAGLYTESDGDKVRELLGDWLAFKTARKMAPCLTFPYYDPAGQPMTYADGGGHQRTFVRFKPDHPRPDKRDKEGVKKIKYESPAGTPARAYFPPNTRHVVLADPKIPLLVTEGEKKALCADQHGIPTIGLGGVWSWQVKREKDEDGKSDAPRELIPDLRAVAWAGREVVICFDWDIVDKPLIQFAEWYLAEQLKSHGATVRTARIPEPLSGKGGLDDLVVAKGIDSLREVLAAAGPPVKPVALNVTNSNDTPDNPHYLIEKYLEVISPGGQPHLIRSWRDDFWHYGHGCYTRMPDGDLKASLTSWTRDEFVRENKEAVRRWRMSKSSNKKETPPETYKVTTALINNMLQALSGACILPARIDAPAWIDCPTDDKTPEPTSIMAMRNGLLNLEAAAARKPDCLLPPDRCFFTTAAVPFSYDPGAAKPVEWLKFLDSLWPNDPESVALLQEWFGYMLTPDTSQQKILFIVGPRRGGKGTIARVLRELVGPENLASPTLASLATNFGLWPLIGKSVALVADARIGNKTDTALVVERLLSISGEDPLTIDRKHKEPLTAKLTSRFVILSNEMLRLGDSSGALVGRFIVLRATQSFYGREDHALFGRLKKELSGILLWAIEGWRRLRARGRFQQPQSACELIEDMENLSSPVGAFVREKCLLGPGYRVAVAELYYEWKLWCEAHGRKEPGVEEVFGQQLRAAVPSATKSRPRTSEGRINIYTGIGLSGGNQLEIYEDSASDNKSGHSETDLWSQPGHSSGHSENPTNPAVVTAVIANPNIMHNARDEENGNRSDAHIDNPVGGHCDRYDHHDHAPPHHTAPHSAKGTVQGMGTCTKCGKPTGTIFTRTCRKCIADEENL